MSDGESYMKLLATQVRAGDVIPGHGFVDKVVPADHPPYFVRLYFFGHEAEFLPFDYVFVQRRDQLTRPGG